MSVMATTLIRSCVDFQSSKLPMLRTTCMHIMQLISRHQDKRTIASLTKSCGAVESCNHASKHCNNVRCAVYTFTHVTWRGRHIPAADLQIITLRPYSNKYILGNSDAIVLFPNRVQRCVMEQKKDAVRFISKKDYTFPEIKEEDLEEQFVKGSGAGGQSVQKTANCVVLKHLPTGVMVRCHAERSLETNRRIAREKLLEQVDREINGENSYFYQVEKLEKEMKAKRKLRSKKRHEIRKELKNKALSSKQDKGETKNLDTDDELISDNGEKDTPTKTDSEVTRTEECKN